jgi:hypothetical protein
MEHINIIESTAENALFESVMHSDSVIKFPITSKYEKNNINVFQICNSNESLRFIDIPIVHTFAGTDIISDIRSSNVKSIQLVLNGKAIDWIPQRIIVMCAPYTEIKLRLFFSILEGIPDTFEISYFGYLIGDVNTRNEIRRGGLFMDEKLLYSGGVVSMPPSDS